MRSLHSLNKAELHALAEDKGVEYDDDDTNAELVAKLEAAGVTEAPSEEEQPEEQPDRPLPRSRPAELPDLDPETAAGVTPLPATAVNPGLAYDDSAAGLPDTSGDEE